MKKITMTFAEPIPDHCPPETAYEPQEMEVFRLVETSIPDEIDFQSHPVRWPEEFGDRRDCDAWGLSVFSNRSGVNRILGLKTHRHKRVARLVLVPASGKVKQSGRDATHYSWWRYTGFNPIPISEVVE